MTRYNGEPYTGEMALHIGRLVAGHEQSIRLLERVHEAQLEIKAQLAAGAPTPPTVRGTRLAEVTDLVKAMQPVALLALLVAAKVWWPELWPFIRRLVADL